MNKTPKQIGMHTIRTATRATQKSAYLQLRLWASLSRFEFCIGMIWLEVVILPRKHHVVSNEINQQGPF